MDQKRLEELTEGLLYMSETDAPLEFYQLDSAAARQWPPAAVAQFLELIGEDPGEPIQAIPPEQFFEELRQGNDPDQVQALQTAFSEELEELRCYRVGEVEIQIYLLGRDRPGRVVGLNTLSVET